MTTTRLMGLAAGLAVAATAFLTSPAPAQDTSTWQAIQDRGSIRIGLASQAEPWAFLDPMTGEWAGIAVSYGREIAKALNVEVEFIEVTWGTAIAALQSSQIDVMPNLSVTPERAVTVEYANSPTSYTALAVLVPDDLQVETWQDLNDPSVTIGVNQGSSQDHFLTGLLTQANFLRFSTYAEVIAAYQSGNVNAAAMYHPSLALLLRSAGSGRIVIPEPVRLNFSDTALRKESDKTLRDWLAVVNNFYYTLGYTQEWYEQFLERRGIDPSQSPPIQRELW